MNFPRTLIPADPRKAEMLYCLQKALVKLDSGEEQFICYAITPRGEVGNMLAAAIRESLRGAITLESWWIDRNEGELPDYRQFQLWRIEWVQDMIARIENGD